MQPELALGRELIDHLGSPRLSGRLLREVGANVREFERVGLMSALVRGCEWDTAKRM